jgi:hypothetical protein
MLHVASVERSIEFYKLLGFRLIDTEGCGPLGWARMHCEIGQTKSTRPGSSSSSKSA